MELELELGGVEVEVEVDGPRGLATLVGLSLLGAAVVTELRTPPGERTWHGRLLGLVPYDLRPPTVARLRTALWDPASSDVLVPTAFGVGWTVNVGAVAAHCGCLSPAAETDPTGHPSAVPA